ncbi:MAG TPA: transporter substrate-binding domain-containing protein [Gammaproteobacteria bacterium]|nr:transporter substrate-binding domain-containing protein [Gammaproteobacteria bacterium]
MKLFKSLFLLLGLTLALIGASTLQAAEKSDVFYNILKKGEITVGVSLLPPWVMKNKKGTLVGFEIDVARQLARDMGVKVKFREYQWQEMIPALKKGKIDIIASGLSVLPSRALVIDFSDPYHSSGYSLVSNLELTKDFTSIKDLNNDRVYIAAMVGTVSAQLAKKVFPNAHIDLRKSEKDATSAVINGSVHALVASSPIPEFISLRHPDKVDLPLKKPLLITREAFAVRKGNQEMLNFLNSWIVAHKADGWIESSHKYWFKSLKWQRHIEK